MDETVNRFYARNTPYTKITGLWHVIDRTNDCRILSSRDEGFVRTMARILQEHPDIGDRLSALSGELAKLNPHGTTAQICEIAHSRKQAFIDLQKQCPEYRILSYGLSDENEDQDF